MRTGSILLIVWLVIGAIAAGQRNYYSGSQENCAHAGTIAVTILAGPLNYVGVNHKVSCHVPQPSQCERARLSRPAVSLFGRLSRARHAGRSPGTGISQEPVQSPPAS